MSCEDGSPENPSLKYMQGIFQRYISTSSFFLGGYTEKSVQKNTLLVSEFSQKCGQMFVGSQSRRQGPLSETDSDYIAFWISMLVSRIAFLSVAE